MVDDVSDPLKPRYTAASSGAASSLERMHKTGRNSRQIFPPVASPAGANEYTRGLSPDTAIRQKRISSALKNPALRRGRKRDGLGLSRERETRGALTQGVAMFTKLAPLLFVLLWSSSFIAAKAGLRHL